MVPKQLLLISFISLLTDSTAVSVQKCTETAKNDVSEYQDQYPSYQCKNAFGKFDHCLRACSDLPARVLVGAADFAKTDNEFIALHKSKEFRHVAIMGFKQNGCIQWGRVKGKMALVNHSCDPNCTLTEQGDVVTLRPVKETEELTIAYDAPIIGLDWNPKWNFQCLCNAHNCRKYLDRYDWNKPSRTLSIVE